MVNPQATPDEPQPRLLVSANNQMVQTAAQLPAASFTQSPYSVVRTEKVLRQLSYPWANTRCFRDIPHDGAHYFSSSSSSSSLTGLKILITETNDHQQSGSIRLCYAILPIALRSCVWQSWEGQLPLLHVRYMALHAFLDTPSERRCTPGGRCLRNFYAMA